MEYTYIVHNDYVNGDLSQFIDDFEYLALAAHKNTNKATARQLWLALMEGRVCSNIYKVKLPFLVRSIFQSSDGMSCPSNLQCSIVLPDEYSEMIGLPVGKTRRFLVSGALTLQIKRGYGDVENHATELWIPPMDFEVLSSHPPCGKLCVQLFLTDLRYVSDYEKLEADSVGGRASVFDGFLNQSSVLSHGWSQFKQTFMSTV
jgi:hypothetical protein